MNVDSCPRVVLIVADSDPGSTDGSMEGLGKTRWKHPQVDEQKVPRAVQGTDSGVTTGSGFTTDSGVISGSPLLSYHLAVITATVLTTTSFFQHPPAHEI